MLHAHTSTEKNFPKVLVPSKFKNILHSNAYRVTGDRDEMQVFYTSRFDYNFK